jgi:hypothetical protein
MFVPFLAAAALAGNSTFNGKDARQCDWVGNVGGPPQMQTRSAD